jgi:hypothetical protein
MLLKTKRTRRNSETRAIGQQVGLSCGCLIFVLLINAVVGGFCFDYTLNACFAKDIPWYADAFCGMILGEIIVPAAIVCWVLHFFISTPFFG